MNRDTDIIREFLLSLIQDPDSTGATPSGIFNQAQPAYLEEDAAEARSTDLSRESLDPLESELSAFADLESQLRGQDPSVNPVTHLGDVSAVQNRFQALLKSRLRSEIERHPPLFPWEKVTQDYPDVVPGETPTEVWITQLRELSIPAVLPDEVLSALLDRCQKVVHQPLKSGIRLVKAVEELFPEQPQTLQTVAQMVLQPAYRSPEVTKTLQLDYEQANPQQQVALTMLAAQEILSALSLKVSAETPTVNREWLTANGLLQLVVHFDQSSAQLQVRALLPVGGYLQLIDSQPEVRTECDRPGELSLILESPKTGQAYRLQVGLDTVDAAPLQFVAEILDRVETA